MKNRHLRTGFAGLCLLVLAAFVLVGCNKSEDDGGSTGPAKAPGANAPSTAGGNKPGKPSPD